jgi:hypothetical protein
MSMFKFPLFFSGLRSKGKMPRRLDAACLQIHIAGNIGCAGRMN